MMRYATYILPLTCFLFSNHLMAQDPKLPATNLGLVNMQDGNPPGTGMVFQEVFQTYNAGKAYNADGKLSSNNDDFSTLLAMQQLIHITNVHFLGGNLGYTVLLPVVKISNLSSRGSNNVSVNPTPIGDLTLGPMVQWFDRRIGNMKLAHRLELDMTIPTGAFNRKYVINPGSNFYTFSLHHAFTIFPAERFSISMRNHLHYNTKERHGKAKVGMFYHNNYSLEFALNRTFRVEATGYYLQQIQQDSYNDDHSYYQTNFAISDTRERVLAYGIGIGYLTPKGTFLELKAVKEAAVVNRTSGLRATLLVNFKLD